MNANTETPSSEPSDGTTLTEVLAAYATAGFTGSFSVTEDSTLQCHECEAVSEPATVEMASLRRLEGASDPDDMFAVVAITCPACSSTGTLILGFGPTAPAEDGDVLRALQDLRGEGDLPSNSAPGEAHGDVPSDAQ
ncbi:MAG: hypothetical protein ABIR32_16340 [Ilumatobacteraceae bacterium]